MPTSGGNGYGNGNHHNGNGNGRHLPPRPPGSGRRPNPYGYNSRRRIPPWLLQAKINHATKRRVALLLLPLYLLMAGIITGVLLTSGAIATPFVVGMGTYQYYYNRVELGKEYSLRFETTRIYDRNKVLLYEKQ